MAVARVDRKLLSRTFDWAKILGKVPDGSAARKDLAALRTKNDQLRERLSSNPENAAPIDFDHYRKLIANPGFVDSLEKSYKELIPKVPYPEDMYSSDIDAREKEADKHFATVVAEAKDVANELQMSLEQFNKLPPFEEMTWDEFFDHFPKYEARMDNMVTNFETIEHVAKINDLEAGKLEGCDPDAAASTKK